jgi:hypothetical protein
MAYGEKKLGGGHAASHAAASALPVVVATATGTAKNVIREELTTVACWRLDDVRFAFGSAFVTPEAKTELAEMKAVRDAHPGAPISIYGHADPVGDEEFNKTLSGWRAEAIYAVLVRDPARWARIYDSDGWGQAETDTMLSATGAAAGSQTRAELIATDMEFLFSQKLEKMEFLGQGADSAGKGDFQGCGEFNPALVFSAAEYQAFEASADKTQRNAENGVNPRIGAVLPARDNRGGR